MGAFYRARDFIAGCAITILLFGSLLNLTENKRLLQSSLKAHLTFKVPDSESVEASVLKRQTDQYPTIDWTIPRQKTHYDFWASIIPPVTCPQHLLARVGRANDGGKFTCGLQNLGKIRGHGEAEPCLVYSFGVKDDSSFEAEILSTTWCTVYAYDMTVDSIAKPLRTTNPRVRFTKVGIDGESNRDKLTFGDILRENGHEGQTIHILKLDIEGSEFATLQQILEEFSEQIPIGQILVEFHIFEWKQRESKDVTKRNEFIEIVKGLEKLGMRMFFCEPVDKKKYRHPWSEFSFLNMNLAHLFVEEKDMNKL